MIFFKCPEQKKNSLFTEAKLNLSYDNVFNGVCELRLVTALLQLIFCAAGSIYNVRDGGTELPQLRFGRRQLRSD